MYAIFYYNEVNLGIPLIKNIFIDFYILMLSILLTFEISLKLNR